MFGRLVMFPDVGEAAFCRKCPMCPEAHSPLVIRMICSRGSLYADCVGPSVVVELTTMGVLNGRAAL